MKFWTLIKKSLTKPLYVSAKTEKSGRKTMTKRKINKIIVHWTATPPNMDIGADEIRQWHKERGWSDIGYHDVIRRNGRIEEGRSAEKAGAHCLGQNKNSIGVVYVGGVGNPISEKQTDSLRRLLIAYKKLYPKATIHGHNEFASTECPGMDVQEFLKENGI